jgi:predicted transcriptional regulator
MQLMKTTVYVPVGEYRRLKAIARDQERKTAQLVRDAISDYVRRFGGRPALARRARPTRNGRARRGRARVR